MYTFLHRATRKETRSTSSSLEQVPHGVRRLTRAAKTTTGSSCRIRWSCCSKLKTAADAPDVIQVMMVLQQVKNCAKTTKNHTKTLQDRAKITNKDALEDDPLTKGLWISMIPVCSRHSGKLRWRLKSLCQTTRTGSPTVSPTPSPWLNPNKTLTDKLLRNVTWYGGYPFIYFYISSSHLFNPNISVIRQPNFR